ncbi:MULTISPECIES: DUF7139 domain-containing protein [Salinibaculum]|uniref:DUF7139 domain-containing protein n=1 Tax=Salinibaculum TaxID=2732368 RepID=UPI0030CF86E1
MTSLTDVYDGGVGVVADPRQRLAGAGLFLAGAAMVVGAIPIATTDLAGSVGLSVFEARELAGVLAGLGVPAVFVGILTVLPAGRGTRAGAAIGASLAILGVALFGYAYPYNWVSTDPAMAVATTLLYSLGTLVTFWCLFVGIATFKTRNDPGGTARLELTDEGTIKVVSTDSAIPGMGGIGLFGNDPDGNVETQTNDGEADTLVAEPDVDEMGVQQTPNPTPSPTPAGDGAGAVDAADAGGAQDPAAANADVREAVQERGRPDRYCGNCAHFEYVRADGEIAPYCGLHDEVMEDMDACPQWDANS